MSSLEPREVLGNLYCFTRAFDSGWFMLSMTDTYSVHNIDFLCRQDVPTILVMSNPHIFNLITPLSSLSTIAGHPSDYLEGYNGAKTLKGHGLKDVTVQGEDLSSRQVMGGVYTLL